MAGEKLGEEPELFDGQDPMVAGYRPIAGIHDELMDADRQIRPHWRPLIDAFVKLGPGELNRRFGFADRHLRDTGVVHRIYDGKGGSERPLQLAHVPLLIDRDDWDLIERAAIQRAELLDRVLADIYGDQTLVQDGFLPAATVAGNPEFVRPLVGVRPAGGSHLQVYAMDVGRGPDGRWWVLADRTQSPSGVGYTVENRIAMSRVLPSLYRSFRVERLAGYFRKFRDRLHEFAGGDGGRIGLLTPGQFNESYFEHAYLARYLGILLLEGEDLTVRDGVVYVRTITGLKRIDILLRRLDSAFADPMELDSRSRIGVPGLTHAARLGSIALFNALGSGVVESRAMLSFLPILARRLLGEDLILPHVATWWCGDPNVRNAVLTEFERRVIAPANPFHAPGELEEGPVLAADLPPDAQEKLKAAIRRRGTDFVAQEAVQLSTMPIWDSQGLKARPFMLRVFASRTADGWSVMPGGFCQISNRRDARAVTLQESGRVADVWVSSDNDAEDTLLVTTAEPMAARRNEVVPARTAENLFWLGRYVERAEGTTRTLRALAGRLTAYEDYESTVVELIAGVLQVGGALPLSEEGEEMRIDTALAARALDDTQLFGAVAVLVRQAHFAGSVIRNRLSPDAWLALSELNDEMVEPLGDAEFAAEPTDTEIIERCNRILRVISAFSGLVHQNMSRLVGWRFLQLGRRLERVAQTASLLEALAAPKAPIGSYEALLEIVDSQITFGNRYANVPARPQVLELVVLDPQNPRSLAFQAERIKDHTEGLFQASEDSLRSHSERQGIRIASFVETLDPETMSKADFAQVRQMAWSLSDYVAGDFFTHKRVAPSEQEYA